MFASHSSIWAQNRKQSVWVKIKKWRNQKLCHFPDPDESIARGQGEILFDGTAKCQEVPMGSRWGQGQVIGRGPGVLLQQEQGSPFPQAPSWAGHLGTGPAKVLCEWKLPAVLWFKPSLSEAKRLKVSFWCTTSNMKQLRVSKHDVFCSLRSHSSKCRAWGCFLQLAEIVIFFIYCCF